MKSICYFIIIIRSNIIKIASELTQHFINFDLKHWKTTDHCIKYLHVIKFLIIRYSNSENESLIIRFRARIKKSRIKKCHQRRIRHRTNKKIINRFMKKQLMHSLQMILIEKALKNISSTCLMIWSIKLSKNNSSFWFSSSKRNFFRCYTLIKNLFDEYIFFRSWNLIRIKK
jgi:hypothetical protein